MSAAAPKPIPSKYTGTAIYVRKHDYFLTEAILLTIENGKVVAEEAVTSSPNLPAYSIGAAAKELWKMFRQSKPVKETK